jgi:type II secretory pathway component PulF
MQQLFQDDPVAGFTALALAFVIFILLGLLPLLGILYLIHFLLTLPLRRNERARFFLDLVELGIMEGRTPEGAIIDVAASRDPALGFRFQALAAYVREGLRLSQALERVPHLLPLQVTAMLRAGERIGDITKVFPACRLLLRDAVSHVRGALNYLLLLAFLATPFTIAIPAFLRIKVLPAFKAVFESELGDGVGLPDFTYFVLGAQPVFTLFQVALFGLMWLVVLAYLAGPRVQRWISYVFPGLLDWLFCRVPWRRKRLQRDFSAMLAVLLDAEVPEAEAVVLAGDTTANLTIRRRAAKVRSLLNEGVKLPLAIQAIDESRELRWRLKNALQRAGGFVRALSGWHEALDARAFQLEQSAAQITTTVFVILNGAVVACIVIAVFLAIIRLINAGVLW